MSLLSVAPAPSLLSVGQAPSLASVAQVGMYPAGMVASPMMSLAQVANGAGLASWGATGVADAPKFVGSSVPEMNGLGGTAAGLGSIGAGVGQARLVGAISVPPTWQGAMPVRIATSAMPGLGGELSSAAMANAAVAPTAGTPMTPMAVGTGGPNKTGRDGASPHVVKSRPRVIPRTGTDRDRPIPDPDLGKTYDESACVKGGHRAIGSWFPIAGRCGGGASR